MASKVFKRNYSVFYYSHDKISQCSIILHGWQVKRPLSLLLTVGVGFINRTFLNFLSGHESLEFIWNSKHSKSSKKHLLNEKFILLEKQISSILWTFFYRPIQVMSFFYCSLSGLVLDTSSIVVGALCVLYHFNDKRLRSLSSFNFYTIYEKTFCNICADNFVIGINSHCHSFNLFSHY